jgi:hypothetical protein
MKPRYTISVDVAVKFNVAAVAHAVAMIVIFWR